MPDWSGAVRERLRGLNLDGPREAEIVEELSQHLDDRYRELVSAGSTGEQAGAVAMEELETHELLAQEMRRTRQPIAHEPAVVGGGGRGILGGFGQDFKVALRMLRTRPGFSAMVISMLAVGVAGNAAIFSIFNGLFLRPLPFAEPSRLLDLDEIAPKWNLKYVGISNQDFFRWQKGASTFDVTAAYGSDGANLAAGDGNARRIRTADVTHELLDVFGLTPILGRNFQPEEDRPGGAKVILLGYDLWRSQFHSDRGVVGRVVKLDEEPYTVIGVLPPEAVIPSEAEAWTPLAADPNQAGSYYLQGVGRVKRGVTAGQARADLLRVHQAIDDPGTSLHQITSPVVQPLRERYLGDVKPVTRILMGAVGLVLLIACVNVAGLMLVRGEARSREIAIRTAVGASGARILRQLLTESMLLAAIGGALGVLLGSVCLRGLISLMPDVLPRWVRFNLDGRFAIFSVALTGAAAIVFGLVPALQAAAVDARGCLQEASRSTLSRGKRGTLSALVVFEVALALVLLVSSGLLVQAFRKVLRTDPGFRADNVITWNVQLPAAKYAKAGQVYGFYSGLMERLKTLPGVTAASAASNVPLGGHSGWFFEAEGAPKLGPNDKNPVVLQIDTMCGYFEAMGIRTLAGRGFDERDQDPKNTKVVVINETFAKHFWPGVPLAEIPGKRIRYSGNPPGLWLTVVGVTHDTKHYGLDQEMKPSVFVPFPVHFSRAQVVVVRTLMDPGSLVAPAREAMRQMDGDLPMFQVRTMSERLERSLWMRRAYSWLFAAFALVAIFLAAAGVYGVVSFAVSRRTREIGIRMALGARPGQVMAGVLGSGMALVAMGLVLGLAVSLATAALLKTLLFGVSMRDLATYTAAELLLAAVGALANFVPARRAARVDPMRALRFE